MSTKEELKQIINLQPERELQNYADPDIAAAVRANETFVGTVMDDRKLKQINEICKECEYIRRSCPSVRYYFEDRENTHRHTCASLTFPAPLYISAKPILSHLSRLFELADGVSMTQAGGIMLSFKVTDLWR